MASFSTRQWLNDSCGKYREILIFAGAGRAWKSNGNKPIGIGVTTLVWPWLLQWVIRQLSFPPMSSLTFTHHGSFCTKWGARRRRSLPGQQRPRGAPRSTRVKTCLPIVRTNKQTHASSQPHDLPRSYNLDVPSHQFWREVVLLCDSPFGDDFGGKPQTCRAGRSDQCRGLVNSTRAS